MKVSIRTTLALTFLFAASAKSFASDELDVYQYFKNLDANTKQNSSNLDKYSNPNEDLTLIQKGKLVIAKKIGREAGLFYAEGVIRENLEKASVEVDAILDFSMYVEAYKSDLIIPAIVQKTNGKKQYLNDEHTKFTYADTTYDIRKQPYFSDKLPSWRDYIVLKALPPKIPSKELLPSTPEEKKLWQQEYDAGWQLGIETAIQSVKFQATKAIYDMSGMDLYGMLRDANVLTKPIIHESKTPVSGTNTKLELNGKVVSIEVMPDYDRDAKNWKIIPQLPPLNDLIDEKYLRVIEGRYE